MIFDYLVYIGRFQPFHNGHKHVIDEALKISHRVVICIGSAFEPRTLKNPWTYEEREALIWAHYTSKGMRNRINIQPVRNTREDDSWKALIRQAVKNGSWDTAMSGSKFGLIGHIKEDTDYMTWFPEWPVVHIKPNVDINATAIRNAFFGIDSSVMPEETAEMLFKLKMGL